MIRDLLMRWAHAAELASLRRQIHQISEQLEKLAELRCAALDERDSARRERDQLRARLDALQPTPTEADVWAPEPGQRVTGESLVLGIDITGTFTGWHATGPYAVLDGGRRVIGRTLRPADQ